MKRFAAFNIEAYNPSGGWNDFIEAFDSLEEAIACRGADQVVDLSAGTIVWGDGFVDPNPPVYKSQEYAPIDPDALLRFAGAMVEIDANCPRNSVVLYNLGDFE
jgi:hypothetical protein